MPDEESPADDEAASYSGYTDLPPRPARMEAFREAGLDAELTELALQIHKRLDATGQKMFAEFIERWGKP